MARGLMIAEPPIQFLHAFAGPLVVLERPYHEVDAACRSLGSTIARKVIACAKTDRGACVIVLPQIGAAFDARRRAALYRHELAHCNGWPADHRGAR